jgi:hypothetical protein
MQASLAAAVGIGVLQVLALAHGLLAPTAAMHKQQQYKDAKCLSIR